MDTDLLVENRIDEGHRLLIELVRDGVDVAVAAWVKTSEEGLWFLYVGSTAVAATNLADIYRTVYACLRRIPNASVQMSDVKMVHTSNPIARDLMAVRDQSPGGRLPARYGDTRLGMMAIDEVYIYPRIMAQLTRDDVIQTVTGLMNRRGVMRPSTVTLRDGTVIRGIPHGLEIAGQLLQVKFLDHVSGSTRVVAVDEVANIQ